MKKAIQFLSLIILVLILGGIIIFFFNPLNLRNKIVGSMINYYFQIESFEANGIISSLEEKEERKINVDPKTGNVIPYDKNPLLNDEQEARLESYGVDVEALPKEITPGMTACFIEKIGVERGTEIVAGATPSPLEILKSKDCLNK